MVLLLLLTLSLKVNVPASKMAGFYTLPYETYFNVLVSNERGGFYFDTVYLRIDTIIKTLPVVIVKDYVFTYNVDSVKPIESVPLIKADSAIIITSTDPTGAEEHNDVLLRRRAKYLEQFIEAKSIKILKKKGFGRFSIVKTWR